MREGEEQSRGRGGAVGECCPTTALTINNATHGDGDNPTRPLGSHLSHKTAQRDPATTPINSHHTHTQAYTHWHTHTGRAGRQAVANTHTHIHTRPALAISHVNEIVTLRASCVRFLSLVGVVDDVRQTPPRGGGGASTSPHCSRQLFIKRGVYDGPK